MVVDDYGHHPVEIKAVLKAAKEGWKRRLVVVFQPHRYTRTKDLFGEFLSAFNDAEKLILTDIYPAGEKSIKGVSAGRLFKGIKAHGHKDVTFVQDLHGHKDVTFVQDLKDVPERLEAATEAGDMVITLGAGDVWRAGVEFMEILKKKRKKRGLKLVGEE
jgi:UDP-N-acetylmuramate--alanine ligase